MDKLWPLLLRVPFKRSGRLKSENILDVGLQIPPLDGTMAFDADHYPTYWQLFGWGPHASQLHPCYPQVRPLQQSQQWQLDSGLGRAYARVSGDYNPIHLAAWSARLLGFSQRPNCTEFRLHGENSRELHLQGKITV